MKIYIYLLFIILYSCSSIKSRKISIENTKLKDSISNLLYIPNKDSIKPIITNNKEDNILYRGVYNNIHIAIPNTKSIKVSGIEYKKKDDLGNYYFDVTTVKGKTVMINIDAIFIDGTQKKFIIEFKIRDIARAITFINTSKKIHIPLKLKKEDFKNIKVGAYIPNFSYKEGLIIRSFYIKINNEAPIRVQGNEINTETLEKIQRLNKGDVVKLYPFKYDFGTPIDPNIHLKRLPPIHIEIIE